VLPTGILQNVRVILTKLPSQRLAVVLAGILVVIAVLAIALPVVVVLATVLTISSRHVSTPRWMFLRP
jgi:hypothetical protein